MLLSHNSFEPILEPFDSLLTLDLVVGTDRGLAATTLGNTLTRSSPRARQPQSSQVIVERNYSHAGEEIHSIDTDRWVVLDAEIDVFADTETEVPRLREIALPELIFLDLQSTLQDFLGLWSTDSDVHSDLFVTTDTEGSDSVSGLAC